LRHPHRPVTPRPQRRQNEEDLLPSLYGAKRVPRNRGSPASTAIWIGQKLGVDLPTVLARAQ
jgi:hypothetical protein